MKAPIPAAIALLATLGVAQAQQEIQWKQVTNIPKGATLPREKADILGIELGDSYAEAKAKLEKLAAEGIQPKPQSQDMMDRVVSEMDGVRPRRPYWEEKRIFRMQVPGASQVVTASFVSILHVERELPGSGQRRISEGLTVHISAPSSGQQVLGISRGISYSAEADQPRVSEVLAQLKEKLKMDPQVYPTQTTATYVYQFNDGKPYSPPNASVISCRGNHDIGNASGVAEANRTGDCDAVFTLNVTFGISRDHAKHISFGLSDNDRAKANVGADFAFVQNFIRSMQEQTRGAPPKL